QCDVGVRRALLRRDQRACDHCGPGGGPHRSGDRDGVVHDRAGAGCCRRGRTAVEAATTGCDGPGAWAPSCAGIGRMADKKGWMTSDEREAFLADVHVGVLAIDEPGRGPLALPVWYEDTDGGVLVNIDDDTRKAELVRAARRATLTVQDETAPYKYVSLEGPASIEPRSVNDASLAIRYLGPELGEWYAQQNPPTATSVTLR